MSRALATGLIVVATVLVAGAGFWLWTLLDRPAETATADPSALVEEEVELAEVDLYFPGPDGRLHTESRELPLQTELTARARNLLEALIAGPERDDLRPVLPATIEVLDVLDGGSGILYVNLRPPEDPQDLAMGSAQELRTVYGLVDTLTLNLPTVDSVVFLWAGNQAPTFAGHVDTTAPLKSDTRLLATPPATPGG